jgi:hypothetical protein
MIDLFPDLYQLIQENAPDAVKTGEIKNQFGRKVAIVCSIHYLDFDTLLTRTLRTRKLDLTNTQFESNGH